MNEARRAGYDDEEAERVQAGEVRGTVALLRQLVPSYRPSAFLADQLDGHVERDLQRPAGSAR